MGDARASAKNGSREAQRGLWRLMLKLPAIRGRLQLIAPTTTNLNEMFEAYEEANVALERFLRDRDGGSSPLIKEYEALCADIESDVIRLVLDHSSGQYPSPLPSWWLLPSFIRNHNRNAVLSWWQKFVTRFQHKPPPRGRP
jgi:hypothetical protein